VTEMRQIAVDTDDVVLQGDLGLVEGTTGVVLFAHGSGSGRHSPRNRHVAAQLREAGLSTLLIDLLTTQEEAVDMVTGELRFDIDLLAGRLVGATDWLRAAGERKDLAIGYFGASTGAAAALIAAVRRSESVEAVVSRGGRPDLAGDALESVQAPTLLIVGGADAGVIELNREAYERLSVEKEMVIVPGATHLFEERGALERVAELAADWFGRHLA